MSAKVINKSEVKKSMKIPGIPGSLLAAMTMKIAGLDKLNELYDRLADYKGVEFADKVLEHLEITLNVNTSALENIPKEGGLVITSNHPFGGLDGLAALSILGKVRKDVKILTNFILSKVPNVSDHFIPINTTYAFGKFTAPTISGLRQAEEHLLKGGLLVIFPAGEVSSWNNQGKVVEDAEWMTYISRQVRRSKCPVIPMYFHGKNSKYFQWLGRISTKLSDLRFTGEIFDKKGKEIKVRIGSVIQHAELEKFQEDKIVAKFLRSRSYMLEADTIEKDESVYTTRLGDFVPTEVLLKELEENKDAHLFDVGTLSCYLFDYSRIPNMMREIAVRREEAFRAVGEGTNNSVDTDPYDVYYKHLVLWDNTTKDLVGAYRLGLGADILRERGIHGFYADTLFRYSDKFAPVLEKCVELGRSFVCVSHQKDTLALMLLLKGLFYTLMKYPEYKYLIGPVSISSWYPMLYRSVMIHYLKQFHRNPAYDDMTNPKTPFVPDFGRVDPDALLFGKTANLEMFDRYLLRMSGGQYRLPPLLKKYIKMGSKIIDYNVDPDFNYCVDGLIMLALEDIPTDDLDSLSREFGDREPIYRRFYGSDF
ncbi:MAG: lysophospholipid acyltransferase family protein [Bacteroidales bacterium]|jgi:putative hemolysin|nr:lysophospholipid acyltransferase family protein [Bacteroidales bacterium]